jgi:hypothetical protein
MPAAISGIAALVLRSRKVPPVLDQPIQLLRDPLVLLNDPRNLFLCPVANSNADFEMDNYFVGRAERDIEPL